jgi:hypothetical protein
MQPRFNLLLLALAAFAQTPVEHISVDDGVRIHQDER